MKMDAISSMMSDLLDVEPKTFGTDKDAAEAAQWVAIQKQTEAEIDAILDPAIKSAYAYHKKLTGEKKSFLEKLTAAKDRVRMNLANWIGAGHAVDGCYIKTTYRVTVTHPDDVPEEFMICAPDEKKLQEWAKTTEGRVHIPGCSIESVHILYAKET